MFYDFPAATATCLPLLAIVGLAYAAHRLLLARSGLSLTARVVVRPRVWKLRRSRPLFLALAAGPDGSTETCLGTITTPDTASERPTEVFVRPEQLQIDADDGVPATVRRSRYVEGRWMVVVQVGNERVPVWSDRLLRPGAQTRVKLVDRPWVLPRTEG